MITKADIDRETRQNYSSAPTSINKNNLPRLFSKIEFINGTVNLDIGGGRYDNVTKYLKEIGVENFIYDPYNRSTEHNDEVVKKTQNGQVDTCTISNVLNVIDTEEGRFQVLKNAVDALKENGVAFITIYEGDKTGIMKKTGNNQVQLNKKTNEYIPEIKKYFRDVDMKNNVLIARHPIKGIQANYYRRNADNDAIFEIKNNVLEKYTGNDAVVTVPDGVVAIGDYAFAPRESLEKIILPEGLEVIGNHAFWHCTNLKEINLPESLEVIGGDAFANCKSLKELNLPEGLEEIDFGAFAGCVNLKKIRLPQSLKKINSSVFDGCESLKEITLPEGLKEIGPAAFFDCYNLEKIRLPEGLMKIGYRAFAGCENLETIEMSRRIFEFIKKSRNFYGFYDFFGVDRDVKLIVDGEEYREEGSPHASRRSLHNNKRSLIRAYRARADISEPLKKGINALVKLIIQNDGMRDLQEWGFDNGVEIDNEGNIKLSKIDIPFLQEIYSALELLAYSENSMIY